MTFHQFLQALFTKSFRSIPLVLALTMLVMAAFIGYDYFRLPGNDIWRGHWAGCGDFGKLKHAAAREKLDYLSLEIKDKEGGQFVMSGELILSAETYKKLYQNGLAANVRLDDLRSPTAFFFGSFPRLVEVDMSKGEPRSRNTMVFPLKETQIRAFGTLRDFPFDAYRIGFVPRLMISGPKDSEWKNLALDTAITNVRLSHSMTVSKAGQWSDYVQDVDLKPDEGATPYAQDECAVTVQRSPWYRAMVVLLIVLLCIPAAYLVFRPDDNPGVDLIAVILGVATIRQFLLGNLVDWTLHTIDMVFVLITVITAAIPLLHIYRRLRIPPEQR